jgi:hypothetical protein
MARQKPGLLGCGHRLPIEVVPLDDGRRARCLRCGQCGPVRADSEGALRGKASRREKIGALGPPPNIGPRGSAKFAYNVSET